MLVQHGSEALTVNCAATCAVVYLLHYFTYVVLESIVRQSPGKNVRILKIWYRHLLQFVLLYRDFDVPTNFFHSLSYCFA